MALEHIKTWRIGNVEVSRIVEVWNREDPLVDAARGRHSRNDAGIPVAASSPCDPRR